MTTMITATHAPAPASLVLPTSAARTRLALRAGGVIGFAILTAFCAQVSFPVPGTPVPVTMQTAAVTLAAAALGPRLGAISMALYIALGLVGLPVFADASGGWQSAFGATGGYLLAFILVPPLSAFALRSKNGAYAGWRGLVAQVMLANLVIFTLGVMWLAFSVPLMPVEALEQGLYPFLPGTLVKGAMSIALGAAVTPWALRRLW